MPRFTVWVTYTTCTPVQVEAESVEAAEDVARQTVESGELKESFGSFSYEVAEEDK